MSRLSVHAAVLLAWGAVCAPAFASDLDPVLAKAMEGTQAPALGVLVIKDGKIAGETVRGVRRNDGADAVTPADPWLIGSDGKPMTAALIARLVDKHKLSWDAPLSKMLPELAESMRPEYRDLTLADLLSHRGGFDHDVSDLKYFNTFYTDTRPLPVQRLAYVAHTLREAPIIKPRTEFSYSNTGFLIAAAIAERATGKSYEELMQREVYAPLHMQSVGFGPTHAGQPIGHIGGKPVAKAEDSNPLMFAPAGNVHLSLSDWAKFCIDQMEGSHGRGALLSAASYRMMTARLPGATSALAWGVQDSVAGRKGPVLTHSGSDGNWYAIVALFPESENGVLVVSNSAEDMGGDGAVMAAMKAVLPELAPEK